MPLEQSKYIEPEEQVDTSWITSEIDLECFLRWHSIDTSRFGFGEAKKLSNLLAEIRSGESWFTLAPEGEEKTLVRNVRTVYIDILHIDEDNHTWKLREKDQEFITEEGEAQRARKRTKSASITEKMYPHEAADPVVAARRALREELQIYTDQTITPEGSRISIPKLSKSYPVFSRHFQERFTCFLDSDGYAPEGYVCHDEDKVSYFEWISIELIPENLSRS